MYAVGLTDRIRRRETNGLRNPVTNINERYTKKPEVLINISVEMTWIWGPFFLYSLLISRRNPFIFLGYKMPLQMPSTAAKYLAAVQGCYYTIT